MPHIDDLNDAVLRGLALEDAHRALEKMKAALRDAKLQIEYLHDKFGETGSGNAVITRINDALATFY